MVSWVENHDCRTVAQDSGDPGDYMRWQDTRGVELIYAGGHCHAPTCISMELWNNDTGELLCRNIATYGGSGARTIAGGRFDEAGYLALPPCLWGSAHEGPSRSAPAPHPHGGESPAGVGRQYTQSNILYRRARRDSRGGAQMRVV